MTDDETASGAAAGLVTIEVESLAPGGDAVGRQRDDPAAPTPDDGRVTFVPLAAPGERVRARVVREKDRVAWAELCEVVRPGPARVAAPCPVYGACGGCQWQHVDLEAQHAAKLAIVRHALGSAGAAGPDAVVAASAPFGYRDRAKLVVGPGGTLGFRGRRSHDVVDVPACLLFGPELARALPALRALARGLPAETQIDVQAGAEGVHVNIGTAAVLGDPDAAEAHARREFADLAGAGVVGMSLGGKPALGRADVDVAEPGGPPLPVPAGGFAQVGRVANAALVRAMLAAVGPAPGLVIELYAGSGNFTRHLCALPRVAAVYASDADPGAVDRGRRAAPGARWALGARGLGVITPDTVVLDPPREGADRPALETALRARRRVVYVSCDPQTLARDARKLQAGGLRLSAAAVLDLMPHTYHAEVVATFDRG